jgi:hypothetical protein
MKKMVRVLFDQFINTIFLSIAISSTILQERCARKWVMKPKTQWSRDGNMYLPRVKKGRDWTLEAKHKHNEI